MLAVRITELIDPLPIYTMWLRQVKRFMRVKARLAGSILMPFLFLAFLGLPLSFMPARIIPGMPEGMNFLDFLAPGIVGMTLLFSATMWSTAMKSPNFLVRFSISMILIVLSFI